MRPVSDVVVLRFAEMALAALLKNRDTALLFVNLRLKACDLRAVLLQLVVNHLDHGTRLVHGFPATQRPQLVLTVPWLKRQALPYTHGHTPVSS